jgi:coenzyme PQQ synthesis protein D (PqqD)
MTTRATKGRVVKSLRADVRLVPQQDGAILLDMTGGTYYQINEVGRMVFQGLLEGRALADLVQEIADHYGIEKSTVERDVDVLMESLEEMGLVT